MAKRRETYDERDSEGRGGQEIDPKYLKIVNRVASQISDEKMRGLVAKAFVENEKIRETYEILVEEGLPDNTIYTVMSSQGAVSNLLKDGRISAADYIEGVATSLRRNENYQEMIYDMREKGVIDERQYEELSDSVEKDTNLHIERVKSGLVDKLREERAERYRREAAVWLFMAIGAILMLVSGYTITAAVIGSVFEPSLLSVIGFGLFAIGIALWVGKAK